MNKNNTEFRNDMNDLIDSNKDQADYAKRQYIMTLVSTVAVLISTLLLFGTVLFVMPKVNKLLDDASVSIQNINTITNEIANTDLEALISDVGDLVTTTEKDLAHTMEAIDSIDFAGLNDAIADLSAVIKPLANFFGIFK